MTATDTARADWLEWRRGGIGASPRACSADGCDRPVRRNELCDLHSNRMYRTGQLELPAKYPPQTVAAVGLLYAQGRTQRQIADELSLTQKVVWRLMRTHGIKARVAANNDQAGPKGSAWRGDAAGYSSLHRRVERERGKPGRCEHCGTTSTEVRYEWANLNGDYADVNDYARLCVPCHRRFDADRRQSTGRNTGMPR